MSDLASVRVLQTWADNAARFARTLAGQDSSWGAEHFPLAGGQVVLCGPGMYTNRAIGVGLDSAPSEPEWRLLEGRCEAAGVPPAFEVSLATAAEVRIQLAARGYQLEGTNAALFYTLDGSKPLVRSNPEFLIEPANDELLAVWQETSVEGWGHTTQQAKAVSNAYASAAAAVSGEFMVVALDAIDRRPVGCASLTINGEIATLGGMSTLPNERGRGVQAALIVHRLRTARERGCKLATTTALPDGTSERNLLRHGFERQFLIETHARGNK